MDGRFVARRDFQLFGYVAVLAVGYVLGSKAGRRRYDQIAGTYRAVTSSPVAKSVIDAGRRKVADRVSPDPALVELTDVVDGTTVLTPERNGSARR